MRFFKCNGCGLLWPTNMLRHKRTQLGEYCPDCADKETCAACGEDVSSSNIHYAEDVKNYICESCLPVYKEAIPFIKPLPNE